MNLHSLKLSAVSILLAFVASGSLMTGCATNRAGPSAQGLAPKDLGEFTIKAAQSQTTIRNREKVVETYTFDESKSWKHWEVYFYSGCTKTSCDVSGKNTTGLLEQYKDYCLSRGGQWTIGAGFPPSGVCSGRTSFEIRTDVYSHRKTNDFFVLTNAFERKELATGQVGDDYLAVPNCRQDIFIGNSDGQDLLFHYTYVRRDVPAKERRCRNQ